MAKNKLHYKKLLLRAHLLKKKKIKLKKVYEFYYMYKLKNLDSYRTSARNIGIKKIDFSNSSGLIEFKKKYENYISKKRFTAL